MKIFKVLLLIAFIGGCESKEEWERKEQIRNEQIFKNKMDRLPPGTVVLEKQANIWWVIQVGDSKYLAHWVYHQGNGWDWDLTPYKDQK